MLISYIHMVQGKNSQDIKRMTKCWRQVHAFHRGDVMCLRKTERKKKSQYMLKIFEQKNIGKIKMTELLF